MKTNRALFLSGFNEGEPLILHVVSRIVDRQFLLGDAEREVFVEMMRMYEAFCEIKVLSFCVMSNHFHLLLEVPARTEVREREYSDEKFLAKLGTIYSADYVKEVKKLVQKLNKNQAPKAMRELKGRYLHRVGDISGFMKSLKQRFSRWYNKQHGRRGTLWEERYSATAVSAGSAARTVAAYIDLNPLRAGMVSDPEEYRWSSYGEAMAGGMTASMAREGYEYLYSKADVLGARVDVGDGVEGCMDRYRMLMAEEGELADQAAGPMVQGQRMSKQFKKRRGYTREEVEEILEREGKLSRAEMLRCKMRYFTDGMVIGSKGFVNGFFKRVKDSLGGERRVGAKPVRRVSLVDKMEGGKLYSYRDLQKDVFGGS